MLRTKATLPPHDEMESALQQYLGFCRCRNLSPDTLVYYRLRLRRFFAFCRERAGISRCDEVTRATVREFICAEMQNGYAIKTINHNLIALKTFYSFLLGEGMAGASPAADVKLLKGERKIIQTFSQEQVDRLLAECNHKTFIGLRDYTVMLTLLDTGLRVSELCGLRLEDIDWAGGFLKVMGKGSKERMVPFGNLLTSTLRDYIRRRGEIDGETHVFLSQFAGPLDRAVVRQIIHKLGIRAGLSGVRVSPHTFRHTFARNWIMNGGDPFSLQRILGHTTQYMVSQYVNLALGDLRVQHTKFSPVDNMRAKARGRKVVLR